MYDLLPENIAETFLKISEISPTAFIGGGFLRDHLLGIPYTDVDIFVHMDDREKVLARIPSLVSDSCEHYVYNSNRLLSYRCEKDEKLNVIFVYSTFNSAAYAFFLSVINKWNLSINRIGFNLEKGLMWPHEYTTKQLAITSDEILGMKDALLNRQGCKVIRTMLRCYGKTELTHTPALYYNRDTRSCEVVFEQIEKGSKTDLAVFLEGLASHVSHGTFSHKEAENILYITKGIRTEMDYILQNAGYSRKGTNAILILLGAT